MPAKKNTAHEEDQQQKIEELEIRLAEAEETLRAIREGEVDAVIVSGTKGEQIFSLVGTDSIYRLIVETMKEAAFTVTFDGTILFCNAQFGRFVKRPLEMITGRPLHEFVADGNLAAATSLLIAAQQQPVKQRLVFEASDGTTVPAHISANVLNQPDSLSICVVASDLTELENSTELIQQLRRQQEAIQAANEELAATEEELRVQNEELATSRAELDHTRARYQGLFETAPDGYIVTDPVGTIQEANRAAGQLLGHPAGELRGNPFSALLPSTQRESYLQILSSMNSGTTPLPKWEVEIRRLEGSHFWADVTAAAARDEEGNIVSLRWLIRDITERKRAQEAVRRQAAILAGVNQVLHSALTCPREEELGTACLEIAEKLTQSNFGFIGDINEKGLEDIAISNPGWDACNIIDIGGHERPPGSFKIHGIYGRVIADGKPLIVNDFADHPDHIGLPEGHPPVESFLGVPLIREGRTIGMIAVANRPGGFTPADQETLEALAPAIVEAFIRKRAEMALRLSEEKFAKAFLGNAAAIVMIRIKDGVVLDVNDTWVALNGFGRDEVIGHSAESLHIWPTDEAAKPFVQELEEQGSLRGWEQEFRKKSGEIFVAQLSAQVLTVQDEKVILWTLVDVTDRKQAEEALRKTAQELERSNTDLAAFAYVASHDLQEPLRMVNGFLGLLRERYEGQLDDKAQEYISIAVDGATRMSALIKDLLEYSRVGANGKEPVPVDLAGVADYARANLKATIEESDAVITVDSLPTVMADVGQMRQLFQNLLGNALKFRVPGRRPEVHIGATQRGGEWLFEVTDNGIGIDPKQADRLFGLFQRLNTRDKYSGTGIGLAICKKIVERSGGRIWVESELGKGATFYFTLPVQTK